jgi:predicted DNA-binding protein (MmcQ/YjbR family)
MDVLAVKELCSRYPGASSKRYGPPSNVLVYYVGGRKFAYFKTSEPERWRFSLCTSPERFLELTDVPGIKPARYMARYRWVTIVEVGTVPEDYLEALIAWSYAKALAGLSARRRSVILGAARVVFSGPARQADAGTLVPLPGKQGRRRSSESSNPW